LSDGTLRAMALVTLLLQPEEELPVLLDEPEPEIGMSNGMKLVSLESTAIYEKYSNIGWMESNCHIARVLLAIR